MSRILGLVLILCVISNLSLAQATVPIPPPNRGQPFPPVTCANIAQEMANLKTMTAEFSQSVAAFMDETVGMMGRWHSDLVTLEGKTEPIAVGQFSPIKEGADKVSEVQSLVWENAGILDSRFDEILSVLSSCLNSQ